MRPFSTSRGGRRGTVTVIVIAFLMIFLVMALTFAFYSMAEADQAKAYRDGGNVDWGGNFDTGAPPDAESLFNSVLGDVIFGPPEGYSGAFNAFRGHDLGRTAFGYNPADQLGATQPFNGVGWVSPQTINPILGAAP